MGVAPAAHHAGQLTGEWRVRRAAGSPDDHLPRAVAASCRQADDDAGDPDRERPGGSDPDEADLPRGPVRRLRGMALARPADLPDEADRRDHEDQSARMQTSPGRLRASATSSSTDEPVVIVGRAAGALDSRRRSSRQHEEQGSGHEERSVGEQGHERYPHDDLAHQLVLSRAPHALFTPRESRRLRRPLLCRLDRQSG